MDTRKKNDARSEEWVLRGPRPPLDRTGARGEPSSDERRGAPESSDPP